MDFSGNFEYAVNARRERGSVISDAIFTNNSGIISSIQQISDWHSADYCSSANDNFLEFNMKSIRLSLSHEEFSVTSNNLTVRNDYSMQLLFIEHVIYFII